MEINWNQLEGFAAVSSVLGVVLALLLSTLARYGSDFAQRRILVLPPPPPRVQEGQKKIHQVTVWDRLGEAKTVHRKQKRLASIYGLANAVLVAGQYIVGGLLTTSFLQENLSKEQIGLFGLVVLGSSIINQHFKPGVLSVRARNVAANLRKNIRNVEDELALLDPNVPDLAVLHRIQMFLSTKLSEIEDLELQLIGPPSVGQEPDLRSVQVAKPLPGRSEKTESSDSNKEEFPS